MELCRKGSAEGTEQLRPPRIWRSLPAAGKTPPLRVPALCARCPARFAARRVKGATGVRDRRTRPGRGPIDRGLSAAKRVREALAVSGAACDVPLAHWYGASSAADCGCVLGWRLQRLAQRSYNHSFRRAFGPLMYLLLWLRLRQRDARRPASGTTGEFGS